MSVCLSVCLSVSPFSSSVASGGFLSRPADHSVYLAGSYSDGETDEQSRLLQPTLRRAQTPGQLQQQASLPSSRFKDGRH